MGGNAQARSGFINPTFRTPGFKSGKFHLWSPFRHTALTFFIEQGITVWYAAMHINLHPTLL
jgi:hypothetical protein